MNEHAILFGRNRSLVGVLTDNEIENSTSLNNSTGVLLLSPGFDHHVGPNGIYVKLARRLALKGYVTLRFGHSGLGDSGPRRDKLPEILSLIDETQNAMDSLERLKGVKRFVLVGLCYGAATAFQVASLDHRVRGLILLNTPIPETSEPDMTRQYIYYWHRAIRKLNSWKRLLLLQSDYRGVWLSMSIKVKKWLWPGYIQNMEFVPIINKMREGLRSIREKEVHLLIIRSDNIAGDQFMREYAHKEFVSLNDAGLLRIETIIDSDHAMTPLVAQRQLLGLITDWMAENCQ